MYPTFLKPFSRRGLVMYFAALLTLTTTTVSVLANAAAPLPSPRESQGVSYVTGGVDLDESTAIKAAMPTYPLVVEVYHQAGGKNEYTASSTLTLATPQGAQVFQATLEGPFALLRVKPGHYDVQVDLEGQVQRKRIEVKSGGSAKAAFVFKG